MELHDLQKEEYLELLKAFLRQEITLKSKKIADFVESLDKDTISKSSIYRIFDKKTDINITLFTLIHLSDALGYSSGEFVRRFEIFVLKNHYMGK